METTIVVFKGLAVFGEFSAFGIREMLWSCRFRRCISYSGPEKDHRGLKAKQHQNMAGELKE